MGRRVVVWAAAAGLLSAATGCRWCGERTCGDRPRLFHRADPPCQLTSGSVGAPTGALIGGGPGAFEGPPPAGLPAYPAPAPAPAYPRADELPMPGPADLIPRTNVPAVPFAPPSAAPADPSGFGASRGGTPAKLPK